MSRAALVMMLATACSSERDMENVCHAEERSGSASIEDPAKRAHAVAMWIDKTVKTRRVKESLSHTAEFTKPQEKGKYLKLVAEESGYKGPCPMADKLIAEPPPPPARAR